MCDRLHFLDFPDDDRTPAEPPGDTADAWPATADDWIEDLKQQHARLAKQRRIDRAIGLFVALLLVGFFVTTDSKAVILPGFIVCLLVAAWYMPLRGGPMRAALDEAGARLQLVDPYCPVCGYALRHLVQPRCPECGRRVPLPTRAQIEEVLAGGSLTVAKGSIASESGWIVLLLMVLAATVLGRLCGVLIGWWSMAVPPMIFLVVQAAERFRQSGRVPPYAVCDACGKSTSLLVNECSQCGAALLAEHVYVKPGLRGASDPRLYCTWAQLSGGACVCAMLVILGVAHARLVPGRLTASSVALWLETVFLLAGLIFFYLDQRFVSTARLKRFEESLVPLCHYCLGSLEALPANGRCARCDREYWAIELAGGRRQADFEASPPR